MASEDVKAPEAGEPQLSVSDQVSRYKDAATVANTTLQGVLSQLAPGKSVVDICEFGDSLIETQVAKLYKSKKIEKGIAFPTCISVNECVGHYSPLKGESISLKAGDTVKVDLGVHIDGFIAQVAHTVVLGAEAGAGPAPVTGPAADVIAAAYDAAEVALRLIKPGSKNTEVTAAIERVAKAYGVTSIAGVLSHQLKQFVIDADKVIALKNDPELKMKIDETAFEQGEAYSIDIAFTTGDGKPRETESRTTVFKRVTDNTYQLKMKASRWVISEVIKRFPALPFTIRALGDETQARLGVTECVKHGMMGAYPVLYEREGVHVAHVKYTVLLLPSGTAKITGMARPDYVKTDKKLDDDLVTLLATDPQAKKKKGSAAAGGSGK